MDWESWGIRFESQYRQQTTLCEFFLFICFSLGGQSYPRLDVSGGGGDHVSCGTSWGSCKLVQTPQL